jgi:hypothetical protein
MLSKKIKTRIEQHTTANMMENPPNPKKQNIWHLVKGSTL